MESMILNEFVNKTNWSDMNIYEAIYNELHFFPKRFHREFLQDIVMEINYNDVGDISKIGSYFLEEVFGEFTEQEQNSDFIVVIGS